MWVPALTHIEATSIERSTSYRQPSLVSAAKGSEYLQPPMDFSVTPVSTEHAGKTD